MSDIFQIGRMNIQADIAPLHPALRPHGERAIVISRTSKSSIDQLVEPDGIEPTTSCLQSRRSPN
jgi:hypothetical protein